jgi:hypothetical protein
LVFVPIADRASDSLTRFETMSQLKKTRPVYQKKARVVLDQTRDHIESEPKIRNVYFG